MKLAAIPPLLFAAAAVLGVAAATITADGRQVFACSRDGGLPRIGPDGEAVVLVDRTPMLDYATPAVPGSLVQVTGRGLGPGTVFCYEGQPLPAVLSSPGSTSFQAPWTARNTPIDMTRPGGIFESGDRVDCCRTFDPSPFQPEGLPRPRRIDPATEGASVHLYLLGLGAVDRPAARGEPSPADRPARLSDPMFRQIDSVPIAVSFAGLAPGMTGVYQVDFPWPRLPERSPLHLECGIARGGGELVGRFPGP